MPDYGERRRLAGGRSARHLAGELDARPVRAEELPGGADLLIVATPPEHHADAGAPGHPRRRRVLVEKPLATTLADADSLVDAAEAAGSGGPLRGEPAPRPGLDRADASTGGCRRPSPTCRSGHVSHRPTGDTSPLRSTRAACCSTSALTQWPWRSGSLTDEAVAVSAELSSTRDDGADDDATVRLRFASGLIATIIVSWTSPEVAWDLQAAAPDGVLRLEVLPEVLLEHDGEPVAVADRHDVADPRLEHLGYVDQLIDLWIRRADRPGAFAAARHVLEVICAAYASAAQGGSEVALPFDRDRSLTPMQHWRG